VLYNGIDINKILEYSCEEIEDSSMALMIKKIATTKIPILVSIGRLDRNKNFSLALNAIAVLKGKGIFVYYFVIGKADLDEEERLKTLADSLGIKDQVFFLGFQQNVLPILKYCKILLVTSLEESFSMVAAESMALGIPFVTTPVAGASEELSNNESCGLVSGWEANEYAEKIELLLKDDVLYRKMSNTCKIHIQDYSVEVFLNSFFKILNEIPQHKVKAKKMNKIWAVFLFILYSTWFYMFVYRDNIDRIKSKFFLLRHKPTLLNFSKFCFGLVISFISFARFPFIFLHHVYLSVKYKKRLFGYE